jgi:hypothetical protein
MALPATHLRFAAAVAEELDVTDRKAFFSGTLYPDSRWVTGVDRGLTHDRRFLDPGFPTDDFTLGWHVHCVCDHIQGRIHARLLRPLPERDSDARWVLMAAAKLVQDMHDAARGDLGDHLTLLGDCRAPNDESSSDIGTYFGFVRRAYHRLTTPRWDDYAGLWDDVGLDPALISKVDEKTRWILADTVLVSKLQGSFDEMVACFKAP